MRLERATIAADNNADLYQAIFESWGLRFARRSYAFVAVDRPPPYYSNLTVLSQNRTDDVLPLLRRIADEGDGSVGLKDSFNELDLQAFGFDILFRASWIWRGAETAFLPDGWVKVGDGIALAQWEIAWKRAGSPTAAKMFRDALLGNPGITILGKMKDGHFVSGCIANKSSDCVGISNVFSVFQEESIFAEATEAVASLAPYLPIVGYKSEADLEAVSKAGYEMTGDLRILVAQNAGF